jgi:hypothetical protein
LCYEKAKEADYVDLAQFSLISFSFLVFVSLPSGFQMSSRRQAVDKLDRTITRLYTYLSGSEEDKDANELASSGPGNYQASTSHPIQQQQQQQRGRRSQQPQPQPPQRSSNNNNNFQQQHHHHLGQLHQQQQQQQEPEYQQPYAYPPAHANAFNAPLLPSQQLFCVPGNNSLGGSTPTSNNSSDHVSEITITESEQALTHQSTLPISGNGTYPNEPPPFTFGLIEGLSCFFDWIRLFLATFIYIPSRTPLSSLSIPRRHNYRLFRKTTKF